MSLLSRYQAYSETVGEMEKAAIARYAEGQALVSGNNRDGGIYLLGYTAEILLKTAYSRIDPAVTRHFPVSSRIEPARKNWQNIWGGKQPSGHDLLFLSLSIEAERIVQGRGKMDDALARRFNITVSRISEKWYVEMRYRRREATPAEADEMLQDVKWLGSHYFRIWR